MEKKSTTLNDIDSKCSSSRCIRGRDLHLRVTGFLYVFSHIFFPIIIIFLSVSYLNEIISTPKKIIQYKSQRAFSRVKDQSSCLPRPLTENQYCSRNARAYSTDYVISMRSEWCAVQC